MDDLKEKERILQIDRRSIRSFCVTNTLWKTLVTCRERDYRMNDYVKVYKIQTLVMANYGMWGRSSGISSSEGLGMDVKLQSYCWLPYSFKRCTYILFCIFLILAEYSKEKDLIFNKE